jgi:HD-GYP domain-containing protein (c-di-GMP phosphodiesterase class II)
MNQTVVEAIPAAPTSLPGIRCTLSRTEVLAALSRVIDYHATDEVPHHARVAVIAARMASRLHRIDRLDTFSAGLIHDIALACDQRDPASFLPNLEDQANEPLLRQHPLTGAQMVAAVPDLFSVAEIILDHHEWINGHGYPRGKSGDEISPSAQVLRFADTVDFVLREQGSPELIPFLDAVRTRTTPQVAPEIINVGMEVLGETGFYAQLLNTDDVALLMEGTISRLAAGDYVTTDSELTGLLELFAAVTDAHPSDKTGHSRRVANLAVLLSMALGLAPEETSKVRWAALAHDVGLVAVPKPLLDKPTLLTGEELAEIRRQSVKTAEFLTRIRGMEEIAHIAASHGEAFDGTGYPHSLIGYEIPIGSRIIAVCDTYDALTSPRPYRAARDSALAIDILVRGSGSIFDPEVVAAAVPMFLICGPCRESPAPGQ